MKFDASTQVDDVHYWQSQARLQGALRGQSQGLALFSLTTYQLHFLVPRHRRTSQEDYGPGLLKCS